MRNYTEGYQGGISIRRYVGNCSTCVLQCTCQMHRLELWDTVTKKHFQVRFHTVIRYHLQVATLISNVIVASGQLFIALCVSKEAAGTMALASHATVSVRPKSASKLQQGRLKKAAAKIADLLGKSRRKVAILRYFWRCREGLARWGLIQCVCFFRNDLVCLTHYLWLCLSCHWSTKCQQLGWRWCADSRAC